ncbi:hypothetical protein [Symmachiella macrocystis]|nr:hypothetical protein [Symmachiella macrocystis]
MSPSLDATHWTDQKCGASPALEGDSKLIGSEMNKGQDDMCRDEKTLI